MTVPASWMPSAPMVRVHIHWTAGTHTASANDRQHYHVLVEGDGTVVRGTPKIGGPIAHTLNANTGAIGVSMCCMGGSDVREKPFVAGKWPMTRAQWDVMIDVVADLCRRYKIPVTPKTVLTHAEVQPNLGIRQRGKWDVTRLAFDPSVVGYKAVGDRMRREIVAVLDGVAPPKAPIPPEMKPGRFKVVGVAPSTLNFRDGPNGARKGTLPEGVIVEKLVDAGDWWQVRTPAGYVGWVWSGFLLPA